MVLPLLRFVAIIAVALPIATTAARPF